VALAALRVLTPAVVPAAVVAQHLLGLALGAAVVLACHRRFGPRAALAAGVLLALDVQGAALGSLVLTETLFAALLAAAALLTPGLWERPRPARAAVVGVLLALAALVKPTALVVPLAGCAVLLLAAARRGRALVLPALVLAAAAYVPIGAWVWRNARLTGRYVFSLVPRYQLLAEHAAAALARGKGTSLEQARLELQSALGISGAAVRYLPLSPEDDRKARRLALATIAAHPAAFARESAVRSVNMLFGPDKNALKVAGLERVRLGVVGRRYHGETATPDAPPAAWALLAAQVVHLGAVYALLALALYRGWSAGSVPAAAVLWLGCAACILVPSLGTPGDPRYRWPAVPLLIAAAASGLRAPLRDAAA
jgi:hypothetical protein